MQRRTLLLSSASTLGLAAAGTASSAATPAAPPPAAAGQTSATALAAQLVAGRLRSEDLVQDCLQRIEAIDRQGPTSTASSNSTPRPWTSPARWTPSGPATPCTARCTACRCCSRTTSPPATA
jgi:hypothetical protein